MYCSVFRKIPWYFYDLEDSEEKAECGLRRRNEVHLEHEVREIIKREIKVPSSLISLKTEQ